MQPGRTPISVMAQYWALFTHKAAPISTPVLLLSPVISEEDADSFQAQSTEEEKTGCWLILITPLLQKAPKQSSLHAVHCWVSTCRVGCKRNKRIDWVVLVACFYLGERDCCVCWTSMPGSPAQRCASEEQASAFELFTPTHMNLYFSFSAQSP